MTGIADVVITQEGVDKFFDEIHIDALTESIKASVNERDIAAMNECEYCSLGKDSKSLISNSKYKYGDVSGEPDLGIEAWINNNRLVIETDTDYQTKKIMFCPMCGRAISWRKNNETYG